MSEFVADTHALYWYLTAAPQLGPNALAAFRRGASNEATIYIPSIVVAELYYLNAKLGRPLDFTAEYERLMSASQFKFVDFQVEDVLNFDGLTAVPEMHDRIIAGVAFSRKCPCITRDPLIVASGLVSIVW